jgi:hypothetical protein
MLLLAIGLSAGSLFGPTLATAADNFKEVLVVNTSNEPVPVSGTINVGSVPTVAPVSEGVSQSGTTVPGATSTVQMATNVVAVTFWSDGLAYMIIDGNGVGNGYHLTSPGGQTVVQTFVNPVPSTEIAVRCDLSNAAPCRWRWAVAGI